MCIQRYARLWYVRCFLQQNIGLQVTPARLYMQTHTLYFLLCPLVLCKLRGVGIGERPERLLVLALVGMAGFLEYALAAVCILAGVTFVHRVFATVKNI